MNDPLVACYVTQWCVQNVGTHEVWIVAHRTKDGDGPDADNIAGDMVRFATSHFEKKWKGTAKDMVCTGGVRYIGNGRFTDMVHWKDVK